MAEQYARDVLAGKIVACKEVKQACQRHLDDLEHGHLRGLHFDPEETQIVLDFYGFCKHSKGKLAGTPIELEHWQAFIFSVRSGLYQVH